MLTLSTLTTKPSALVAYRGFRIPPWSKPRSPGRTADTIDRFQLKAAALVQSVAGNHGFADGNKRTALLLLGTLLARSGYQLTPVEGEEIQTAVEQMVLDTVTHRKSFEELTVWFRQRIARLG